MYVDQVGILPLLSTPLRSQEFPHVVLFNEPDLSAHAHNEEIMVESQLKTQLT